MYPADVLQRLDFKLRLDELRLNGSEADVQRRQAAEPPMSIAQLGTRLDVLRRSKRKQTFRLDLRAQQWRIRLNGWPPLFDVLRPIAQDFVAAGAHTTIQWTYEGTRYGQEDGFYDDFPIELDWLKYILNPSLDWIADVMHLLEKVSRRLSDWINAAWFRILTPLIAL